MVHLTLKDHFTLFLSSLLWQRLSVKQERIIQDKTKVGPFIDFLQHFLILLLVLKICNLASQLGCETMFKISSINNEKFQRKTKKEPILVLSFTLPGAYARGHTPA